MTNKWILGSTLSTLIGIVAATVYLMLIQPHGDGSQLPNHNVEWLLWFFFAMVLVSMLVNLSVLIAPPANWLRFLSAISLDFQSNKLQLNQYQERVQLFMQSHHGQLQRLTSQADIYLWVTEQQPAILQVAEEVTQHGGIEDMRLLFRWMLTHQCRLGYYVSLQPCDVQAEIFAKEAGIQIIDVQTLQKLHSMVLGE